MSSTQQQTIRFRQGTIGGKLPLDEFKNHVGPAWKSILPMIHMTIHVPLLRLSLSLNLSGRLGSTQAAG